MIKKLPTALSVAMAFLMLLLSTCNLPAMAEAQACGHSDGVIRGITSGEPLPEFNVPEPSAEIWLPPYKMTERGKAAEAERAKHPTLLKRIKQLFSRKKSESTPSDRASSGRRGVEYKIIEWEGHKYGWVRINDLEYRDVDYDFERALNDLDRQGAEGIIVDIRDIRYANDFDNSIYCSHRVLKDGTLSDVNMRVEGDDIAQNFRLMSNAMAVTTYNYRDRSTNTEYYRRGREECRGKPMLFIADHNTAQGAEILLAAVRENKRCRIVGETTYGDGRTTMYVRKKDSRDSRNDRVVRADSSEFYDPNNHCIGSDYRRCSDGIKPDYPVQCNSGDDYGNPDRDPPLREALTRMKEQSTKGK